MKISHGFPMDFPFPCRSSDCETAWSEAVMEVTQSSAQKRKKFGWEFTKKNEGISMDGFHDISWRSLQN